MPTTAPVRARRRRPDPPTQFRLVRLPFTRLPTAPVASFRRVPTLVALVALAAFTYVYRRPLDFAVYRRAAVALTHGAPVYAANGEHLVFTYPPFAAALFGPLALIPAQIALLAFTAVSLAATGVIVHLSARPAGPAAGGVPAVAIALLILTEPTRTTMTLGQVNLVVCALVLIGETVVRRHGLAGACVGLAAGIKITPALFAVIMVARGARPRAAWTVLAFALSAVLGVIVVADGQRYWTSLLWQTGRVGDIARYGNQSVRATLSRLLGVHPLTTGIWALGCATVLICLLLTVRRPIVRSRPVLAAGVTGVGSCLICPVSWGHHWVWSIPLIAGLFTWPVHDARYRQARRWAWLLLAVFLVGPNTPVVQPLFRWTPAHVVIGNDYVLTGLAVLGWLAAPELRRLAGRAIRQWHPESSSDPGA